MNKARQRPFAAIVQTHLDRRYPPIIVSHGAAIVTSSNAVSWEWLNAYERGLGEQYSLHASDPHMGWDDSGTKALVGSQFVLARDVEFSCAASLTFVSWNGSARGSL